MVSQLLNPLAGEQGSCDPQQSPEKKHSEDVRPRGLWSKAVVVGIS